MRNILLLLTILLPFSSFAGSYMGLNYGYSSYGSDQVKEYKLNQKGPSYGGFVGVGKDFVGLEGFYQSFSTSGKIKHDGGSYDYTTNASALGAALRFSFNVFYARLGFGRYKLNQKIDIDDQTSHNAANEIYNVQNGVSKNGVLFSVGAHRRFGNSFVTFIDYSRHQITGAGSYDVISAGFSFNLPERLFGFDKL